jgi:hypothetical protein
VTIARPVPIGERKFFLLPFVLGLTCIVEVELAGRLMGTDLVCLGGFAWCLVTKSRERLPREITILVALALLWLLGAVITDLWRETAWEDWARGQSRIVILIAGLVFLGRMAVGNVSWVICFWAGVAIGRGIKPLIIPQYGFDDAPWKFGLAMACLAASVLVLERVPDRAPARRMAGTALIGALSAISLLTNARSTFAILLVVAVLLAFRSQIQNTLFKRGPNPLNMFAAVLLSLAGTQAISLGYSHLAETGALGHAAQQKYFSQARLGFNEIQSGRNESLVSLKAIADAPVIGHGSWARDHHYKSMLVGILRAHGATVPPAFARDTLIPSHSQLLGAWVEHGILGVPFWLYVIALFIRVTLRGLTDDCRHREVLIALALLGLWNVLFSPFGAEQRVVIAASCAIAAGVLQASRARRAPLRPPSIAGGPRPGAGAHEPTRPSAL